MENYSHGLVNMTIPQVAEEKKLELRLGPPGEDEIHLLCPPQKNIITHGANKRGFVATIIGEAVINSGDRNQKVGSSNNYNPWAFGPSSTYPSSPSVYYQDQRQKADQFLQYPDKNLCPTTPADCSSHNPSAFYKSYKRNALLAQVVGWPPISSCRKNVASNSSKQAPESCYQKPELKQCGEKWDNGSDKGLFVKINMDGVPIGRKVDLGAYDNYEKLSSAVNELFRGLLEAQRGSSRMLTQSEMEEAEAIVGSLDGSGIYALVYEDNEGDRVLVGDVPWHMFVSSAKRLRVLKKSDIPALDLRSSKLEKKPTH